MLPSIYSAASLLFILAATVAMLGFDALALLNIAIFLLLVASGIAGTLVLSLLLSI